MPTGEALFAASEIASALGITPQAVHKQMRGIPPGVKIMRGVRASAWPASAFPKEQRALLDAIATRKGYRGPCHVVSDPPSRWHPEIPFAEIAPHCLNTASQRRNLLTPILREHHTKKVEEIVRLALAAPGGEMFSASSLRRYITLAKFRDRGHLEWELPEIYLDEKLARREPVRKPLPLAGPLARTLASVGDPLAPTPKEIASILADACAAMQDLLNAGAAMKAARRAIIAAIECSGVNVAASRDALRKRIDFTWPRWQAAGSAGLADGRKTNGAVPLAVLTEEQVVVTTRRLGASLKRGRKSSRSRKAERPCGRGWRNQRKNEHPESAEKLASASREVRQFDGAAQRSPR